MVALPVLSARVLLALLLALPTTWAAPQRSAGPINSMCPVMEDEPIEADILTEFEGHTIAFCCQRCRRDFLEDPAPYADWIAAQTGAGGEAVPAPEVEAPAPPVPPSPLAQTLRRIGRFHPLLVHFPVALFLAAALAEGLYALRRRPAYVPCVRFCLALGAAGALAGALLGWAAAFERSFPDELVEIAFRHRWLGTITATGGALVWALSRRASAPGASRVALRLGLLVLALLVAVTAHLGGELAWGPGFLFR